NKWVAPWKSDPPAVTSAAASIPAVLNVLFIMRADRAGADAGPPPLSSQHPPCSSKKRLFYLYFSPSSLYFPLNGALPSRLRPEQRARTPMFIYGQTA